MRPTFDCHNMTYSEVEDKFENWILLNSKNLPADVITGNSQKMREIVKKYLDKYDFKYVVSFSNQGLLNVLS